MLTHPEITALLNAIAIARLHRDYSSSGALQVTLDRFGLLVADDGDRIHAVSRDEYLPQVPTIDELIEQRQQARSRKDWDTADKLRAEIERRTGMRVVDGTDGVRLV